MQIVVGPAHGEDPGLASGLKEEGLQGRHSHRSAVLDVHGGGHLDVLMTDEVHSMSFPTVLLLAAALCVHSILEGMALGAQHDPRAQQNIMIAIAGALSSHIHPRELCQGMGIILRCATQWILSTSMRVWCSARSPVSLSIVHDQVHYMHHPVVPSFMQLTKGWRRMRWARPWWRAALALSECTA
jgi:hypothetical protein